MARQAATEPHYDPSAGRLCDCQHQPRRHPALAAAEELAASMIPRADSPAFSAIRSGKLRAPGVAP